MLVPMRTSWARHRRHAMANFLFRAAAFAGFGAGVFAAVIHRVAAPPPCDVQHAQCMTRLLRYEAVAHVLPPVVGLMAGMVLGAWLARAVHRAYARANAHMG
jgi:uncharacterized membrane protein YfcA